MLAEMLQLMLPTMVVMNPIWRELGLFTGVLTMSAAAHSLADA